MKPSLLLLGLIVSLSANATAMSHPSSGIVTQAVLGTAFTYQGQIKKAGVLVNGACEFQFSLWDAASAGNQVGTTQALAGVNVTNGLFNVPLDFGTGAFIGDARWLELAVKCPGDAAFTTLTPRQAITPVPYALALPGFYTEPVGQSVNIIGGLGEVRPGVVGATIAGGGKGGNKNYVMENSGTIGGGNGTGLTISTPIWQMRRMPQLVGGRVTWQPAHLRQSAEVTTIKLVMPPR